MTKIFKNSLRQIPNWTQNCMITHTNKLISLFLGFRWLFTRFNRKNCFHSWWVFLYSIVAVYWEHFFITYVPFFSGLLCLMVLFWNYFCTGSDDVIVACVREVIDQLNQVSMSSKGNDGINFSPHTKDSTLCSEETSFLSTRRGHCDQHGWVVELGLLWYNFASVKSVKIVYTALWCWSAWPSYCSMLIILLYLTYDYEFWNDLRVQCILLGFESRCY